MREALQKVQMHKHCVGCTCGALVESVLAGDKGGSLRSQTEEAVQGILGRYETTGYTIAEVAGAASDVWEPLLRQALQVAERDVRMDELWEMLG